MGGETAYEGVATGSFVNRNSYATFLGMGLCLGIALTLNHKGRARSQDLRTNLLSERNFELSVMWLSVGIIALALLATQSRMGLVSALAGSLCVVGFLAAKRGLSIMRASGLFAVSLGALFLIKGAGTAHSFIFVEQSAATRFALYAQIAEAIWARPWLGYGLDTFPTLYEVIHRPPVPTHLVWDLAHSTYLALWLELGLVVGSLPMIAVALTFGCAFGHAMRRKAAYAVPIAAVGATVVAALHSTVDFSLEMPGNVFVLLLLLAMGSAQIRGGS